MQDVESNHRLHERLPVLARQVHNTAPGGLQKVRRKQECPERVLRGCASAHDRVVQAAELVVHLACRDASGFFPRKVRQGLLQLRGELVVQVELQARDESLRTEEPVLNPTVEPAESKRELRGK